MDHLVDNALSEILGTRHIELLDPSLLGHGTQLVLDPTDHLEIFKVSGALPTRFAMKSSCQMSQVQSLIPEDQKEFHNDSVRFLFGKVRPQFPG